MRIPLLALALLLAPAASASVIVVDPANGPGSDFTSLSDAISAAVSGDVLLLRSGTYDGTFVVGSKSLAIVADAGASVTITNSTLGSPAVAALRMGSQVAGTTFLRGVTLSTPPGGGVPLIVAGTSVADSHAYIEECKVLDSAREGMRLENGSPATVVRCNVNGSDGDPTPGPDGFPITSGHAAVVAGAGPLALFGGIQIGGEGLDAGLYGPLLVPTQGQDGESGIRSENTDNSVRVLAGGICIGGLGGDGAAPGGNCLPPGDGGDGVLATVGGNVHIAGTFGLGDLPGVGAPGCNQTGTQGDLLAAEPPGQLPTWLPGAPATVTMTRVAREQEGFEISIAVALDQPVKLLVGFAPQFVYYPNFSGVLAVMPTLIIDPGPIDFTGNKVLHPRVPELGPGVESLIVWIQPYSKDGNGHKVLGIPSATVMLDEQF